MTAWPGVTGGPGQDSPGGIRLSLDAAGVSPDLVARFG